MNRINICPSTLAAGYTTYSPKAMKHLFGDARVSPFLDFGIDKFRMTEDIVRSVNRISVSGAQVKISGNRRKWENTPCGRRRKIHTYSETCTVG